MGGNVMLQVKNITKSYTTGEFTQTALDGVSLNFRKNEFVAVLGPSGSGKTTFLNVIGGLDQYDSGDLIIKGKSTKQFKDSDWDAYRNNSVGFIFQSYNLISHLSIVDNVEMGMTLSGVSSKQKHRKALEALEKVGLKDHIHKKPNQLSGGQMQRVAIARALANDPEIILADEPTGALDTVTSCQIMDLIKEISKDKLVIMVTHNPELAQQYADRIIRFRDGKVIDDSNPYNGGEDESEYKLKKTSMSFFTALKLSGKNISTKKWRTALTAFASSIGIIGIALILSLSTGFQIKINEYQQDALAEFPVIISQSGMNTDTETMKEMQGEMIARKNQEYTDEQKVFLYNPEDNKMIHINELSDEYMEYVDNIDPEICGSVGYMRIVNMNLLKKNGSIVEPVTLSNAMTSQSSSSNNITSMEGMGLPSYPEALDDSSVSYLEKNYDLLAGAYPESETDLVLIVDKSNRLDYNILKNLGFRQAKNDSTIGFDDIVGTEFKLVANDDYYEKTQIGSYMPGTDYESMYNSSKSTTLTITGIVRLKEDASIGLLGNGIAYSDKLVQSIIDREKNSDIVKAQRRSNYNVMTMQEINGETRDSMVSYLGGDATPVMIFLYPKDFESKELVLEYLDEYNEGKSDDDVIIYNDLASTITGMTGSIMDTITLVLVAFAAISLVVSLIMIAIITYISVLERTKEIGVLRALGARKKDITRVFNAETFIIGICSGLLGIGIAFLLTIPTNSIIESMTELPNVAQLNPIHAILLVAISVILTLLGGFIPAKMAAKKDPVEALRTE